jgi:2-methylcitrate dehydratase PrpD
MSSMSPSEPLTPTQQLAVWSASRTRDNLAGDVIETAKDCLLDHIAVSLYGMGQPWTTFVIEQVAQEGGHAQAGVYGRGLRVPARAAALVNGTAAHAFELDDWHAASLSHLGACVIPAVLAAAERERLSGLHALVAIVVGFEAMARVGMATIPSLLVRGYHPTGTHGPIGAAAAVGNLLGISAEQMTAAIGIGASCAGGLMEFTHDPHGAMVKRFHAGRAAEAGVIAADLARKGMTAPKSGLDGQFGYCRVFADAPDIKHLTSGLGDDYQIRHINIKPYACCGALHAGIDAIEQLVDEHRFCAADVENMVFGGNRSHVQRHACAKPDSVMAAQYSMPYAAAVALSGRALDPRMFDEGRYADSTLLASAAQVAVVVDPEVERVYPNKLAGSVRIRLKDGRSFERLVLDAKGTTGRPMGRDGVISKARALCRPLMQSGKLEALVDMVLRFDAVRNVTELTRCLDASIEGIVGQ